MINGAVQENSVLYFYVQYPSMCLQSMVGEEARFDYVVFEYYMILRNHETKLIQLAQRVRARFPRASLIFLVIVIRSSSSKL